jgi:hypothetical protein
MYNIGEVDFEVVLSLVKAFAVAIDRVTGCTKIVLRVVICPFQVNLIIEERCVPLSLGNRTILPWHAEVAKSVLKVAFLKTVMLGEVMRSAVLRWHERGNLLIRIGRESINTRR